MNQTQRAYKIKMYKQWEKEFPETAPKQDGLYEAIIRCVGCYKPHTTLCEACK